MLGTVRMILTRMVTWLKTHLSVTTLKKRLQSVTTGASAINQTIRSAMHTLRAWTKQSKEQLLVHSRTLLDTSMKLVITLALLTLGVLGLLAHLIVLMIQQLASKLWKRGQ
jgi:CHASE3 domain sensor protein